MRIIGLEEHLVVPELLKGATIEANKFGGHLSIPTASNRVSVSRTDMRLSTLGASSR